MILEDIKQKTIEALKAKDEFKTNTYRLMSSSLHNAKIKKGTDLTDEETVEILQKEAKKRRDSIEAYEKAGANDKAEIEKKEIKIISEFLPAELNDEELEKAVDEAIAQTNASSMADMGKVMGVAMGKTAGRADGNRVSAVVRKKLS